MKCLVVPDIASLMSNIAPLVLQLLHEVIGGGVLPVVHVTIGSAIVIDLVSKMDLGLNLNFHVAVPTSYILVGKRDIRSICDVFHRCTGIHYIIYHTNQVFISS